MWTLSHNYYFEVVSSHGDEAANTKKRAHIKSINGGAFENARNATRIQATYLQQYYKT